MLSCFGAGVETDENGYAFACQTSELKTGQSTLVKVGRKQLVLFKVKTDRTHVYAMSNSCVHQGTPLAGAPIEEVDGRPCVTCPGHGYQYDLANGKSVGEQAGHYVQRVYAVKKKDNEIWVKVK